MQVSDYFMDGDKKNLFVKLCYYSYLQWFFTGVLINRISNLRYKRDFLWQVT